MRSGISNSDFLESTLGLPCLGKNDFDAIEGQRKNRFFARALNKDVTFIKWNPRQTPVETIAKAKVADASTP